MLVMVEMEKDNLMLACCLPIRPIAKLFGVLGFPTGDVAIVVRLAPMRRVLGNRGQFRSVRN